MNAQCPIMSEPVMNAQCPIEWEPMELMRATVLPYIPRRIIDQFTIVILRCQRFHAVTKWAQAVK